MSPPWPAAADDALGSRCLAAATAVGEAIVELAEPAGEGVAWQTTRVMLDRAAEWCTDASLYNGTTGIALFLAELGAWTGRSALLEAAAAGFRWVSSAAGLQTLGSATGFLTGRAGVLHASRRAGSLFGRAGPHHPADDQLAAADPLGSAGEYLAGAAGRLVAFADLWSHLPHPDYAEQVVGSAATLARGARLARQGVVWDRLASAGGPLAGMSHGTAGIAFALMSVGRRLDVDWMCWLALGAWAYEDSRFDHRLGNWVDLRRDPLILEGEWRGAMRAAKARSTMSAWCHGAPGVALARHRCEYDDGALFGGRSSPESGLAGLERSLAELRARGELCLCHGLCGNLDIAVDVLPRWGCEAPRVAALVVDHCEWVCEVVEAGAWARHLRHSIGGRPDPSLFCGLAGVGYFLLRMASRQEVPSVLAPVLGSDLGAGTKAWRSLRNRLQAVGDRLGAPGSRRASLAVPWLRVELQAGATAPAGDDWRCGSNEECVDDALGRLAGPLGREVAVERCAWQLDLEFENRALLTLRERRIREHLHRLYSGLRSCLPRTEIRLRPQVARLDGGDGSAAMPAVLLLASSRGIQRFRPEALARLALERTPRTYTPLHAVIAAIGEGIEGFADGDGEALVRDQLLALCEEGLLELRFRGSVKTVENPA